MLATLTIALCLPPACATAADNPAEASVVTEVVKTTDAHAEEIRELQRQAEQQRALIEQQKTDLNRQQEQINAQQQQLDSSTKVLSDLQTQLDQLRNERSQAPDTDEQLAMRKRLEELESQVRSIPEDPASALADDSFPGSLRVPGSNAAYKIGGYAKVGLIKNFDPLVTQDRFIVGSIPVTESDETALASETRLTANQTRINFDYRQKRDNNQLRAFIEGDFFGTGDTFRLRHAYGQFRQMLAGKTWSVFYDSQAAPEEVDFEGINGHVVLRQTQVRFFPEIGQDLRFIVSLEDPAPQVTGGAGVSDLPDLVASIRRTWFDRWHVKTAMLLRQVRAVNNSGVDSNGQPCVPVEGTSPGQPDANGCVAIANAGAEAKDFGWAVTASGKIQMPIWAENDSLLCQFNYGHGLGRYLTDLASIYDLGIDGGQDGVIDPVTGELETLPVFGGYIAFQHWWKSNLRSTFIGSMININNLDSQADTAYHQTRRLSGNLIWSPVNNIDIGAEYLWGKRINKDSANVDKDGEIDGTATQLQLEAVYRF